MTSLASHMKDRLIEMILLTVAGAALFSTVTYGFHVEDSLRQAYVAIIAIPLVLTALFTALSFSPRTAIFGSAGFAVAFFLVAAGVSAACGHAFFYDEYGNVGFFLLLGTIVSVLGFVMTRRKTTTFIYAAGGCFTCGLIQFMYENGLIVQLLLFVICALALAVIRVGSLNRKVIAADEVPLASYLVTGAGIALGATLLSCLVFALVIFPLNPPRQELKLVTEYYSLETVYVHGEQQIEHKEDQDNRSNNELEGNKDTNNLNSNTEDVNGEQGNLNDAGNTGESLFGPQGFGITGYGKETQAVDYFVDFNQWVIVFPILLLLVAAIIGAKILLRKRRFNQMVELPPRQSIMAFYRFFDQRFRKAGIARNEAATPLEHAMATSSASATLEEGAEGSTFAQLASSYCACVYGRSEPHEDEIARAKALYRVFYKNIRRYVGPAKYLRLFFRL